MSACILVQLMQQTYVSLLKQYREIFQLIITFIFRSGSCMRKTILSTLQTPVSQNSAAKSSSVPSVLASSASRAHLGNGRPCQGWCQCSLETWRCLRRSLSPATSASGNQGRRPQRWPRLHPPISSRHDLAISAKLLMSRVI